MADKIVKLLQKLPPKQLQLLLAVIKQIHARNLEGLDVKTLVGRKGLYRVRVGNYRIIFRQHSGAAPRILTISRRNEKTYKDL